MAAASAAWLPPAVSLRGSSSLRMRVWTMIVAGGQFGMNLDEVEGYLKEYSPS